MRATMTVVVTLMWAALLLGGSFRPQGPVAGSQARPQAGYPAPPLTAFTVDGNPVAREHLAGKAVYINFWASWCPPCRIEMPEIERLAANLPPETMILTINVTTQERSAETALAYLQSGGYTFPVALDPTGQTSEAYRVVSLPTNLFISPQGIITARINGPLTYGAMLDYLRAAGR